MAIACVEDDGEERCYVNGAPTNEDCESLARYMEKHWGASYEKEYDVGANARYAIDYAGSRVLLVHDSQLGNYFTCPGASAQEVLREPLADLERRLA